MSGIIEFIEIASCKSARVIEGYKFRDGNTTYRSEETKEFSTTMNDLPLVSSEPNVST